MTRDDTRATTSGARPSGWLIGGVLAIVALAIVAWLVFAGGGADDPEPTLTASASESASAPASVKPSEAPSEGPSEAPSEAPSVEPSEAAQGPFTVAWTPASGFEEGSTVIGVERLGSGWVALGQVTVGESWVAAIWTSGDGATWTRAQLDTAEAQDRVSAALAAVELDGTLVAIGTWGSMGTDQRAWLTWTSSDGGATWTEDRREDLALAAITKGGPGLVAAGWLYTGILPFDSYIATSADGVTWERTSGLLADANVQDIGVIGDRVVAVGQAYVEDPGEWRATAWYSDDVGETWTAVDLSQDGVYQQIHDLAAHGDGLVAVAEGGGAPDFVSASLSTGDGATWEGVEIGPGAISSAVAAVGGGLVAVGNVAAQDIGVGLTWTSADGSSWTVGSELGDGSVRLGSVASDGERVVAGGECLAASCETVVWVGEVTR